MDLRHFTFFVLVAFAAVSLSKSEEEEDGKWIMKEIVLDEITPQGVISLPPNHYKPDGYLCHYWISFLKNIPEEVWDYHKDFGISVVPVDLELQGEDSIALTAHADNNTVPDFEKAVWDSSLNSVNPGSLEFHSTFADICVHMKGDWSSSKAKLVATFYYRTSNETTEESDCPSGMISCDCPTSQQKCISEELFCNGVSNCGANCTFDESKCSTKAHVMKEIALSEVTPQGIMQLPPTHYKTEGYLCHYWISFLQGIPEDVLEHHKDFGISIVPFGLKLQPEDSIVIMGHPVDGNSSVSGFETVTWDSSSNSASPSLEFNPKFQDICINLKGNWSQSKAKLVATLFYDNAASNEKECPSGMSKCECSSESTRCIATDLLCNGVSNCGKGCSFDESSACSNSLVMKEVILSEVVPQGHLRLPLDHYEMDNRLCHYWISFLKDIPQNALPHHKNFGISIVPLNIELKPEDSIELIAHSVAMDGENPALERVTWDSSSNSQHANMEFKPLFADVCINLKGNWTWSSVHLLATLYYDNTDRYSEYCPTGMTKCQCSSPYNRRCIYKDLLCNGSPNCGLGCNADEGTGSSCNIKNSDTSRTGGESCTWSSLEYFLMMVMTGLMLILIPAVFMLTLMYYRRMMGTRRSSGASFDGNNNFNRRGSHVISMRPSNDIPPRYDDLPEGVKAPLPPVVHNNNERHV